MTPEPDPDLCPSCAQPIGQSVAWCSACAAWFRAIKDGVCTVDPPYQAIDDSDYEPVSATVLRRALADLNSRT